MAGLATQSHACCTVPAVVADDYQQKGEYITVDGLKTYATGSSSAKKAILIVYDIFGFYPQTIQGADILAYGDEEQQYQVFMPDFFEGSPAELHWLGSDKEEDGKKLGEFFNTKAQPGPVVERIPKLLEAIKSERSGITDWATVGFCWGGKVVNLSSKAGTPFKAAAACHPAMIDPKDAAAISIPFALLPSGDEPKEDVDKWEAAVKVKNIVQWYPNQLHGFMAARADLKNPEVESEYKKAYRLLLTWFHDHV